MHRGYLRLWRKFFDENPFWKQKRKFSKAEAWIDLLQRANYREKPIEKFIAGRSFMIGYGELVISLRVCGFRWGWKKDAIHRFLKSEILRAKIATVNDQGYTRIKILNYGKYNDAQFDNATVTATITRQWRDSDAKKRDSDDFLPSSRKNKERKNISIGMIKKSPLKNFQYPDWLNQELWRSFCQMRSRIKKPITTERTITRLLNTLKKLMDQGHDQDELIQSAIDYCWQSFYPPRQPDDESKYI